MSIKKDPEMARIVRVNLEKLRYDRGLTLEEMKRLTGICCSNYHLLETGYRLPTIGTLHRICKGLGVSSSEILGF